MKRGDTFTHRHYFTEYGGVKTPLPVRVTRVARGTVYYRGVYGEGTEGTSMCCPVEDAHLYLVEAPK